MKVLSYEEWYNANEEKLDCKAAEDGSDRELDYCPERYADKAYDAYVRDEALNDWATTTYGP